jgi:hypothetical protein
MVLLLPIFKPVVFNQLSCVTLDYVVAVIAKAATMAVPGIYADSSIMIVNWC